ncbi:FAD-dependent oxidoreductase [Fictibacillus sp. b24]|uniref:FAD-dependent oxidoreductase n=1 Tax=Fictibacillus sp. b24 TaxID=3055863 RepID=UPI003CD0E270
MKLDNFKGLTGEIVLPGDEKYEEARQEWNRAIQKFPSIIVYCCSYEDVSNAIKWAQKHSADIRIRSGGHHYEGYSIGNGVLVIDISRLNAVIVDEKRNLVTMQAGIQNKDLYDAVGSKGYPFPGGTCPTVGVSGFVLGAGWGFSSRLYGLGCDSLVELEMINYKGERLKVNNKENSDLFWACKGAGGGNFGVMVSMTFKLPPKVDQVTLFQLYKPNATTKEQREFLRIWQKWLVNLDNRMTLNTSLYNSSSEGLAIYGRGFFYGTKEQTEKLLKVYKKIEGLQISAKSLTFLEAVREIESTYPPYEKFKSTGRFVYKEYDREELEAIVSLVRKPAKGSVYAALTVYSMGGQIRKVSKTDTAFYYRKARYILGIQSVWEDPLVAKENKKWVEKRFNYLETITKGSFVNFPYRDLKNYQKAYFGRNVERLQRINKKYDPRSVFSFPQSIR